MRIKNLTFVFFLSLLLVFGACSKSDCSEFNTKYDTYSLDEELGECVVSKSIERDICGNGVLEDDETLNTEELVKRTLQEIGK